MQQSLILFFFIFLSEAAQQGPDVQKVCLDNYAGTEMNNYTGLEKILNSSRCTLKNLTEEEKAKCKSILECKIPAEIYTDFKVCLDLDLGAGGSPITQEKKATVLRMEKESCDNVSDMRMKCSYKDGQLQGTPTGADPSTTAEDCLIRTRPLPTGTGTAP